MNVNANQDVDGAMQNKQRIEAIQDEQNDIAASEQLSVEQGQDNEPPKRVLEDGEVDITDHGPSEDPRQQYANDLIKAQRERRDQEIQEAKDNNGYRPPVEQSQDENQINDGEGYEEQPQQSEAQFDNNSDNDVNLDKPGFYDGYAVAKIDGQLVKLSHDQALSLMQKHGSADQRLEQASLKERELNQREFAIQQREQYQPPNQGVEKATSAEVQKEIKQAFELFEEGDTEQAVEHMTNVLSRQNPTATPEQITNNVLGRLKRQEASTVESRLMSSGKYDDVLKDPTAYSIAVQNVQELNRQRYSTSPEEVMLEAIERVRDFRTGLSRQERLAQSQDDKPNNRRQQKRTAARPVASSSATPRKTVVQKREPTEAEKRRDLFAQAKAARNQ